MKNRIILTLCCFILFFSLLNLNTPNSYEPIYHPLADVELKTLTHESIKLIDKFPDKNYLICFFVDTSPTSKKQLKELIDIVDKLPDKIVPVLIHIGRLNSSLSEVNLSKFNLFLDIQGHMAAKMNIYVVPTTMLLTNNQYQIFYSREYMPSEKILSNIE